MNIRAEKYKPYFAIILSILLFFSSDSVAFAQNGDTAASVLPANISITLSPGGVWHSALTIKNDSDASTDFFVYPTVFTGDSRLVPVIPKEILPLESGTSDLLGKDWLKTETKNLTLDSAETGQISFSLSIPEDAVPGLYNIGFLVGKNPNIAPLDNTAVSVGKFFASVISVRVTDSLIERLNLREFSVGKRFYTIPIVPISLRLENKGKIEVTPKATLQIEPIFGISLVEKDTNKEIIISSIQPASIKTGNFAWSPASSGILYPLGLYKASVAISYGANGQQLLEGDLNIVIIPRVILFLILILFLIFGLFIHRFKK